MIIVFLSAPVREPLRCDRDDGPLYLRMKETFADHYSMFTSIFVIILFAGKCFCSEVHQSLDIKFSTFLAF